MSFDYSAPHPVYAGSLVPDQTRDNATRRVDAGAPRDTGDRSMFEALPIVAAFWLVVAGLFLLHVGAVVWGIALAVFAFITGRRVERRCARLREATVPD